MPSDGIVNSFGYIRYCFRAYRLTTTCMNICCKYISSEESEKFTLIIPRGLCYEYDSNTIRLFEHLKVVFSQTSHSHMTYSFQICYNDAKGTVFVKNIVLTFSQKIHTYIVETAHVCTFRCYCLHCPCMELWNSVEQQNMR